MVLLGRGQRCRLGTTIARQGVGGQPPAPATPPAVAVRVVVEPAAGHAAGDALLKQLATLMSTQMRASDIVARLGGDEFGLILRNCSLEYAESFMRGLISDICHCEFRWNGQTFHIGASAGLVPVRGQFPAFGSLLASADQACYAAKRAGRGQVKIAGTSF